MPKEILKFMNISNVDVVDKGANKRVHLLTKRNKDSLKKKAKTFSEMEKENEEKRNLYDDIWALESSIVSIIEDPDLSLKEKVSKFKQTVKEFSETVVIKRNDTQHEDETMPGQENLDKSSLKELIKNSMKEVFDNFKKSNKPEEQQPSEEEQELYKSMVEFMGEIEEITKSDKDIDGEKAFNEKAQDLLKKLKESKVIKSEEKPEPTQASSTDNEELKKRDAEIADLKKRHEELELKLRKKEYLTKAEKMQNLAKVDELADFILEAEEKLSKKNVDFMNTLLKSTNEQLEKSGLFNEIGSNAEGDSDNPYIELDKQAQELMKNDTSIKHLSVAREEVMAKNENLRKRVFDYEEKQS
jgi:hypothetical protein